MTESATSALAKLEAERERAASRVDAFEREARAATAALGEAREALIAAERQGGAPAERKQLEQALAAARAEAEAPWPERIEGARQAARLADAAVRQFTAEHLSELVDVLEQDGEAVAARLNAACAELLAAYVEREAIAGRISALLGPGTRPGDVSSSNADAVARAARDLVQNGGEEGPKLRRDRSKSPDVVAVA